jgi:hypothetical protein
MRGWRTRITPYRLAGLAVFVAVLPVLIATVSALVRDELPVGDNALITLRAADVGTEHNPLLGTWSSASISTGTVLHHPGPLFFEYLALPVRLLGPPWVALGVGLLNAAAIVGIAVIGARRGGAPLMAVATAIAAALSWTLGSYRLVEPWQPHAMLLPFLLFLMLVWTVSCGDGPALPWLVLVGSLVLQTHLSYVLLVSGLSVWAVVWLLLSGRGHREQPGRRSTRWWFGVSGLVLAVCWALPLWQQFTSGDTGNLGRLVGRAGDGEATVGFEVAARMLASVLTLPMWWLRPSFRDAWLRSENQYAVGQSDLPSLALAVAGLVVLALVLAACWWLARRRQDGDAARAVTTAAVALVIGLVTAAVVPAGVFGIAPHQFRWLWPLAAFTTFAIAGVAVRAIAATPDRAWRVTVAAVAVAVVLGLLNIRPADAGVAAQPVAMERATELARHMGVLEDEGPLLVKWPPLFNDPFAGAVMVELQRRGIPFLVEAPYGPQVGSSRVDHGTARAVVSLGFGDHPRPPRGAHAVARAPGVVLFLRPLEGSPRARD